METKKQKIFRTGVYSKFTVDLTEEGELEEVRIPFSVTSDNLDEIIQNFQNPHVTTPDGLPVWIGHPDDTVPSVGWIMSVDKEPVAEELLTSSEVESGNTEQYWLTADIDWTDEDFISAAKQKKWKYCSVELTEDWMIEETAETVGWTLTALGITNTPRVRSMPALEFSLSSTAPQEKTEKYLESEDLLFSARFNDKGRNIKPKVINKQATTKEKNKEMTKKLETNKLVSKAGIKAEAPADKAKEKAVEEKKTEAEVKAAAEGDMVSIPLDMLKEKLGNPELTADEAVEAILGMIEEVKSKQSEENPAEDPSATAEVDPATEEEKEEEEEAVVGESGLKASLKGTKALENTLFALQKEHNSLKKQLHTYQMKETETLLDSKIKDGYIPSSMREDLVKLSFSNPESFKSLVSKFDSPTPKVLVKNKVTDLPKNIKEIGDKNLSDEEAEFRAGLQERMRIMLGKK